MGVATERLFFFGLFFSGIASAAIRPDTVRFPCDITQAQERAGLVIAPDIHGAYDQILDEIKFRAVQGRMMFGLESGLYGSPRMKELFDVWREAKNVPPGPERHLIEGIEDDFSYSTARTLVSWFRTASLVGFRNDKRVDPAKPENDLRLLLINGSTDAQAQQRSFLMMFTLYHSPAIAWADARAKTKFSRDAEAIAQIVDRYLAQELPPVRDAGKAVANLLVVPAFANESAFLEVITAHAEAHVRMAATPEYRDSVSAPDLKDFRRLAADLRRRKFRLTEVFVPPNWQTITDQLLQWRDLTFSYHIAKLYCEAARRSINLVVMIGAAHQPGVLAHLARAAGGHQLEYSEIDMDRISRNEGFRDD